MSPNPKGDEETVKVIVRCRPMNSREIKLNCSKCVELLPEHGEIRISKKSATKQFTYDAVYDENSTQSDVYIHAARALVDSVITGFNGTIFAYGQTGSGKTFTMEGAPGIEGLIPNSFKHIFEAINDTFDKDAKCLVQASMLEIYNEEIRDLLAKDPNQKLELKEHPDHGVYVKGLTTYVVKSVQEISRALKQGKKNRVTGSTDMNAVSSRSHCVFIVRIETSVKSAVDGEEHIRVGKLNMVDLAGSERSKKTGATGMREREGININKSLSALGKVIMCLVDGKARHIPYRNAKLTRLLQDSLGGNTKTVMIANISPASDNYDETLSTLRYATACKQIKNKPRINEDPKDAKLRVMQDEISKLKQALESQQTSGAEQIADGEDHAKQLRELIEKNAKEKENLKKQMQQKSEEEKTVLLQQQQQIEEERKNFEEKLKKQEEEIQRQKQEEEQLKTKLDRMQSQVMHGGVNLIEANEAQKQRLERLKGDLESRMKQQQQLEQALVTEEEERLDLEKNYSSKQEEAELKTKKIKKLWTQYQQAKQEVEDIQVEFQREREDSLDMIRQLEREIKLKVKIIQSYIPDNYARKIYETAEWNEEAEVWRVRNAELAGNHYEGGEGDRSFYSDDTDDSEYEEHFLYGEDIQDQYEMH